MFPIRQNLRNSLIFNISAQNPVLSGLRICPQNEKFGPSSQPLTIDTSQRFRHTLRFRDAENPNRRGKPDGVFGCKLFLKIGGPPPASIADCEFITLDTASPYLYEFEPAAAGQTGWWIACWVNPRQENGPCSETVGATIPG